MGGKWLILFNEGVGCNNNNTTTMIIVNREQLHIKLVQPGIVYDRISVR